MPTVFVVCPMPERLECRARSLEREGAVEDLAVAALEDEHELHQAQVGIELSHHQRRRRQTGKAHPPADQTHFETGAKPPAPPGQQHRRREKKDIRRLRKDRHPEQHGGDDIGPTTVEPAAEGVVVGARRDLLVEPEEVGVEDAGGVEQVGRQIHGV